MKKLLIGSVGWRRNNEWQKDVEERLAALRDKVNEIVDAVEPPSTPQEILDDADDLNARAARAMGWHLFVAHDGEKWWLDCDARPRWRACKWIPLSDANQATSLLLHVCNEVDQIWSIESAVKDEFCVVVGHDFVTVFDSTFCCAVTKAAVRAWEKGKGQKQ